MHACRSTLEDPTQRAVGHTVVVTTAKARSEHRWQDRTGATRDSIEGEVSTSANGASGEISAGENAKRLNDGTPPHPIHPKEDTDFEGPLRAGQSRRAAGSGPKRHFLRFQVGGQTVFARAVNHPGTKPDPFLDAAADACGEEFERAVGAAIDEALGS